MIETALSYLADAPPSEWLVYGAMLFYVLGFLFKDQIVLRILILIGTGFYIAYYYTAAEAPLWAAIVTSAMIGVANVIGFCRLIYGRIRIGIPERQRALYAAMGGLRPGEFRRLMKLATHRETTTSTVLTREGATPESIFFVTHGRVLAKKGDLSFEIPTDNFIGEISFVLGCPASACVHLPEGGTYIEWNRADLRRAMDRSFELERSVEALMSRDMAKKVAASIHAAALEGAPPLWAQTAVA